MSCMYTYVRLKSQSLQLSRVTIAHLSVLHARSRVLHGFLSPAIILDIITFHVVP